MFAGGESVYEPTLILKDPRECEDEEREGELLAGRFMWFSKQRIYPGKEFPSDSRQIALYAKKRMSEIKLTGPVQLPGCNWVSIGPRDINGRIRALAIHPTDGSSVYAGSANAGVWVTGDAGESWKPLMHDEPALEIGALAVHLTDPSNPSGQVTIFAGTGEPTSWPGYKGAGVLKSTDSGATWNLTGTMPAPSNDRFSAILIDPTSLSSNPTTTVLYTGGTPGGLYKSADGGTTWQLMLNKDIKALAMDPTNSAVIYAAVAFEGISKYDPTSNTWNTLNTGLITPFPQLIAIAIGQSAPHKMYAKLDQMVYMYNTATASWQALGNHGGITYGYWNNVLGVDPQDSNIVFAGGISFERSSDGGTNWQGVAGLHSDPHALAFDSTNHLNVYAGNDGGVYRGVYTSAIDAGSWTKVSDGLILTQFNQVGVSPSGPGVLGGGSQDNGTNRTLGGLTWDNIFGGDGGFLVIDPANPYILYAELENGTIYKSVDGGASWGGASVGFPSGPWVTPIVLDPTSPPEPNRVLFAGSTQVYRSTNSAVSWSPSSPSVGGSVIAIVLAPSSSAVVYAGTDSGRVWRSSDNGATMGNWRDITTGTVAGSATLPGRSVNHIAVHTGDPDTVFVAFSGFNTMTPTTSGHVFRGVSADGGATWKWTDISSNLPDIPANSIQVNPATSDTLYAGTDIGVFRTTNGGLAWTDFSAGLPNVVVSDLALSPSGDRLIAATYGYGMFELHLNSSCPAVDVYMRDNKLDTGETIPSPSGVTDPSLVGANVYWWESADIKVDSYPYYPSDPLFDGVEFDLATAEDVVRNDAAHPNPNHLYLQVHNRVPSAAHNVIVKALWADASAGLPPLPTDFWSSYPNDWTAASGWHTVDASVPFQFIPELFPHTPKVLLWNWVVPVTAAEHTCMLAVISADEDPVTRSDANPNDHLLWVIVPNDKRITLRNLHVITLAAPYRFIKFIDLHNAQRFPQYFDLAVHYGGVLGSTKVSLLLPKVFPCEDMHREIATGVEIGPVTGEEWWWQEASHPKLRKEEWRHHCSLFGTMDSLYQHRPLVIPRILIPPRDHLRAALIVSVDRELKPGSTFRLTLVQRERDVVVGGSTFEIRIPPIDRVCPAGSERRRTH